MYRMDWTDDRLQERFDSIDRRFDSIDRRLDKLDSKVDGLQRAMVQGVIALTSTFIAGFAALIVLIATQL
jgi:hypothetical protein